MILFKQSRTGFQVPELDGIALHSLVDPVKEAIQMVDAAMPRLMGARTVIVLGLGGGFHLDEIKRQITGNIVVIEARQELADEVLAKDPRRIDKDHVLVAPSTEDLLESSVLLEAMAQKFAIFKHAPSIRIASSYYSKINSLLTDRRIEFLKKMTLHNPRLYSFFERVEKSNSQFDVRAISKTIDLEGTEGDTELIVQVMRELIV
ncbi:MAG: hypothetical protein IT289_11970 [Oligoflexia bacterium]|nr:hypothetical protein [Oligoflexia bacterium]